ncbi:MAG TPA: hypothetical protein VH142_25475 [Polyangiaceae bacterium]|jgi:ribosome-binding protein aMBF1 (putative translation factor)|nr:hypothetical protein [Polyangiaceae bacterium]
MTAMPTCKRCGEDAEELTTLKIDGKSKKVCEDCASLVEEGNAVAEESEAVVQKMMDFKGRR